MENMNKLSGTEIIEFAIKALERYPAYLAEQEVLRDTISKHPAFGVLKMSKKDVREMCKLILPDIVKFVEIDNCPEDYLLGISAKDYKKTHNGFIYDKDKDCFKLRFWAQANWIGGASYFIFRIHRNLDLQLLYLDGNDAWHIHNQIEVRKLVEKYL